MATEDWVKISSGNGLLPDGTKPLPELMLTGHQWSPVTFILGQFHKRWLNHQSLKSVVTDGTKPLPEPMLISHQWGSVAFTWEQFHSEGSAQAIILYEEFENFIVTSPRGYWVNFRRYLSPSQVLYVWKLSLGTTPGVDRGKCPE